jgi:hypothetical protein
MPYVPQDAAEKIDQWDLTAAGIMGLNTNLGDGQRPREERNTDETWQANIAAFVHGKDNGMTPFPRTKYEFPDMPEGMTRSTLEEKMTSFFKEANAYGYNIGSFMLYNNAVSGASASYSEEDIQNVRDWLDENGHADVELFFNLRAYKNAALGRAKNPNIAGVVLEAAPALWYSNKGNRQTLLNWLANEEPLVADKKIIFQIPVHAIPSELSIYQETRRLVRWFSSDEMLGNTDFIRRDDVVIMPVVYSPTLPFYPEMSADGNTYADTQTGIALSLIEQKDLFEGRVPEGLLSVAQVERFVRIEYASVADNMSATVDEDSSVAITLTGSDINGDSLSFTVETQPANGSLSGTAPNLTYSPNANYYGSDSFTFTVNDSSVATVSITVNPVIDETEIVDLDLPINAVAYDAESHPSDNRIVRDQGTQIGFIKNGSWVKYASFNFDAGAAAIDVEASSLSSQGTIEVRVDSPTGTLLGSVNVLTTGSWNSYETFSAILDTQLTGTHDLYLVFTGGSGSLFNIRSFMLLSSLDVDTVIAATGYDEESHPADENIVRDAGANIGYIQNGSWVRYNDFHLYEGVQRIDVEAASKNEGGTIEVRADSTDGTLLASVEISDTGGWSNYETFSAFIAADTAKGIHDIYFVFVGGTSSLFNLKNFSLSSTDVGVSVDWDGGSENVTTKDVTTSVTDGVITLALDEANADPYIRLNDAVFDADVHTVVQMRIKNNSSGTAWKIYFAPAGSGEVGNFVDFTMTANSSWEMVTVDMTADADFVGAINSIRLDPEGRQSGSVEIDFVQIIAP